MNRIVLAIVIVVSGCSKETAQLPTGDNVVETPESPSLEAIAEAKQNPNGWVYKIVGDYGPDDAIPPEAIEGAWKVDEHGNISGEFIPNSNFEPANE